MLRALVQPCISNAICKAASTSAAIKPGTKYGGKTTVTLIPGTFNTIISHLTG